MKVLIAGMGLIGGSFALALRDHELAEEILGVENSEEHAAEALQLGLADRMVTFEEGVAEADLVVLATPADTIPLMAVKALNRVNDKQVVMDMGSIKSELCEVISMHAHRGRFVAAHPMWGTEYSGPKAAQRGAFTGRSVVLCDTVRSDKDALGALLRHPLASPVGGKVSDSGMGFLLLGFLLERVFDMPLDEAAKRFVTAPLHMGRTGYLPSGSDVAPTSIRDENGVLQPGCPLDGNARFLHGVAGHSGLFTNLEDATRFASMLSLNGRTEDGVFLSQRAVHLVSTERTRGMNAARGYGFHITKRQNPFLGLLWPSDGYGLRDPASGSALAVSPLDGFFTVILMNGAYTPANRAEGERFLRLCLNAAYAAFQHETGCEDCE